MPRWQRLCILIGLILAAVGCDSRPANAPIPAGRPKIAVLASVYPMAEMVHQIGGDHVDVQWLAEDGERPEEIAGAGGDLKQRANRADMVITAGPWDAWAVAELSEEAREARLVEPMRMPAARTADARSYLWLDPAVVRELVEAARTRLSAIDANREPEYRANARAYLAEVDAVDQEFRQGLAGAKGRAVLAVRPVWTAMCARYGLELRAPVLPTGKRPFVTDEALEQADFKLLAQTAKAAGISVIFVDVATPIAVRQQIEEKTGLRAVTLDAMGTSAAEGRNTWAKVMRYNLAQLKRGLE